MEADEKLTANKIEDVFDYVCEGNMAEFGSRSMRLEVKFSRKNFIFNKKNPTDIQYLILKEAILISLSRISSFLK